MFNFVLYCVLEKIKELIGMGQEKVDEVNDVTVGVEEVKGSIEETTETVEELKE